MCVLSVCIIPKEPKVISLGFNYRIYPDDPFGEI